MFYFTFRIKQLYKNYQERNLYSSSMNSQSNLQSNNRNKRINQPSTFRKKLNHSSLHMLDRYKRDDSLQVKQRHLNTESQQKRKIRLKTQYKEIKDSYNANIQNRYCKLKSNSFLLTSDNFPQRRKEIKCKKFYETQVAQRDANILSTSSQATMNLDPSTNNPGYHPNKQQQNEWVNSVLPILSAQALYQQNHQLKKQLNHLKEQNSRLSSKLVLQKKQKERLAQQLSLQNEYYNFYERFDLFDNSSFNNQQSSSPRSKILSQKPRQNNKYGFHPVNYMITGIKYRYEKLKADYEQKCKQVDEILRITQYTAIQEVLQYNKILEADNTKLVSKVQQLSRLLMLFHKNNFGGSSNQTIQENGQNHCFKSLKYLKGINLNQNESQSEGLTPVAHSDSQEYFLASQKNITILIQANNRLSKDNSNFTRQNAQLQKTLESLTQQLKQKTSSMKNMHTSLTLLDNELYHKKKQISKILKLQKQIDCKLLKLEKENATIKVQCQKEMQNAKLMTEKMFQTEKKIFLSQMQQKNQKIAKLEKEISYLSTLLKYLKPLDQDELHSSFQQFRDSQKKASHIEPQQSSALRSSMIVSSNRKRTKTKISQHDKSTQDFKLNLKQPVLSMKPSEVLVDGLDSQYQSQEDEGEIRVPKTSRQKHSSNGFKARKINPNELEYMKEQIKYRCMARRLSMHEIREFFSAKSQTLEYLTKREASWNMKYITMKELQQILTQSPFLLTLEQSHKLSRFITQDSSAEHVYCDPQNQIQREIVKSIIKAFIGEYNLPDLEKCRGELKTILNEYGTNLKKALDALSDWGNIQPGKMFALVESLKIQMSDELKSEIMARLYQKSQNRSLATVRYEPIFASDFI